MIGKKILHYKITEKLGEGGMGIVYKAEDTKLERTVALKFLSLASIGEEEKKRFKREAKAAASLNHSNIAHVYAIDEGNGQMFIAMEYIEGQSLEQMVGAHGGVPLRSDDAINYATQIAAGLQAAHEKGIVHRDIKSANIMMTGKGVVKIMDFGLAKLTNRSKMTQLGTTLGTISYMSPEQSQGKKVDHRSDIWSLGVVLYEMITGQMPFKGDYEQAIIYSIQNEDPEPLTAVRTGVPMDLERIVNKLLAKDPRDRYQNILELPVDLKNVNIQNTTASQIRSSGIRETMQAEKKLTVEVNYSYKTILKIAALGILTFALGWILKPGPPHIEPKPANKMVVPLPENVSLNFPWWNRMAISPDGADMVFLASRSGANLLLLKRRGSFETTELVADLGWKGDPFFSTDGRWLGYFDYRTGEIYQIATDGGEPLRIASFNSDNRSGATFAPDNTIIFADEGVLKRIPETGGEPAILTKTKSSDEQHQFPRMLPDGKTVLFTVQQQDTRDAELNTSRLAIHTFGDDAYRIILDEEGYNGVYSPTGHILYGRSNRLMAVPFDLKNLRISGVPVSVLENVHTHQSTGSMSYALSKEGTLIYVPGSGTDAGLRSVWNVDLSGKPSEFFDLKKRFTFARYSPDGKYVAFRIEEDEVDNIWVYHIDGAAINQLTFYKKGGVGSFAWSPDSKNIAYDTMDEDSTNSVYVKRIKDTGTAQKVYTSSSTQPVSVIDWSNDGDKLSLFTRVSSNSGGGDIVVYSFQDSSAEAFLATPAFEAGAYFSPNGKWIVYVSNVYRGAGGGQEVYVRPYPKSNGGVWKISDDGGSQPCWSPDGMKIYYRRNGNEMYSVDVTATDTFSKGTPEKLFVGNYFLRRGRKWDIHPDGNKFIMIQDEQVASEQQKIFVIQNFDEELKRLVPTGKN